MSEAATAVTAEQFDDALRRYYKLMGQEYENQFSEYCEENGFDDLAEEMGADHTDCMLVDFDEDIPFKQQPKDKMKAIFDLLLKIYHNPDTDFQEFDNEFTALQISKQDYKVNNDEMNQMKKLYSKQLTTIFSGEMKDDPNILTILAISEKKQLPYLLYLTDMFSRDRIAAEIIDGKNLQPSDWVAINKHCHELKKTVNKKAIDTVQHAITTFYHRIVPKLMLSATTEIMDDLETTARYISTQVDFVHNLAQKGNKTCPFQLDACIAYNKVTMIELMDDDLNDDDIEEDDEVDDTEHKHDTEFTDQFGSIKKKLKSEGLLHEVGVIDDEKKDSANAMRAVRAYKINYDKFKAGPIKSKYKGVELEDYPRNHRFCSFIDRRKPNDTNVANDVIAKDEIIFFEPADNCNAIPRNCKDLWYFDSSKTSIIPNVGYTKSIKEKDKKNAITNLNKDNINSGFGAKGALLMMSFHVLDVNTMRAYLYLNGQVTRFFPQDIIDILPRYFDTKNKKNQEFIKGGAAKVLIANMKPKLRDLQFEAFYNEYKYKKK